MTEAQTRLVEENRKLVFGVINRKFPWLAHDEDVVSVGMMGLCKAAIAFDPQRGFAFSTLAWASICNEIGMYLRKDLRIKGNEICTAFLKKEVPEEEDPEGGILDVVGIVEEGFEAAEFSEDLENALSDLTENQKQIVRGVAQGKRFVQIAQEMGTSKQYVNKEFKIVSKRVGERMKGYD